MQLEEKRTRRGKEESFDDSRPKVMQFGTMKVIRARRWPRTKAVHASTSDRLKKDHPESEHKSALHKLTARSLSLLCVAETPTLSQTGLYRVNVCVCARARARG